MCKLLQKLFSPFFTIGDKQVARSASQLLSGYLKLDDEILDLGCGSGIVAKTLINIFKVKLLGVDVNDFRIVDIPFKISDGKLLPFKAGVFDDVCIFYVLHHTLNAEKILKEAKRVARRRIYVLEDTPINNFTRSMCNIHGATFKLLFGLKDGYKFFSEEEWIQMFQKNKLKVEKSLSVSYFNPIHNPPRTFFILTKS